MKSFLEYMAAVVLAWVLIIFVLCIMGVLLITDILKGVRNHVLGTKTQA